MTKRLLATAAASLMLTGLVGCSYLTFPDAPQSTMQPMSDFARTTDSLYWTTIYVTTAIFVVVQVLLTVAVIKFREKPGQDIPEQVHGNLKMELGWTFLPVVILVVLGVPSVKAIWSTQTDSQAADLLRVKVVGKQWWFAFEYPELGLVTANEFHIPAGRPIRFELHTGDVLHSFWIPRLGGKRDLIPGKANYIWMTADAPPEGQDWIRLEGQCAELCGDSHGLMRMHAVVHTPESFEKWVAEQKAPALASTEPKAAAGAQAFLSAGCVACHTVDPANAQAYLAPNLAHFASRPSIAANRFPNTDENLAAWLRNPQAVKPGAIMPNLNLNDQQVDALVAYLQSLK